MRRRKKRRREKARKVEAGAEADGAHANGDGPAEDGEAAAADEDEGTVEAADELVLLQVCSWLATFPSDLHFNVAFTILQQWLGSNRV